MAKDKSPVKDNDQVNLDDVEGGTDAGVQEQQSEGTSPIANLMKSRVVKILGYSLIAVALIIISVLISTLVVKSYNKTAGNLSLKDKRVEEKKEDPLAVFTLEEFKLSTADKEEPHFLRVIVTLAYDEKDTQLVVELNARRIQITDQITRVLMSKTKEELDDVEQRDVLKEQIRESVSVILQQGEIKAVYLTSFMVT